MMTTPWIASLEKERDAILREAAGHQSSRAWLNGRSQRAVKNRYDELVSLIRDARSRALAATFPNAPCAHRPGEAPEVSALLSELSPGTAVLIPGREVTWVSTPGGDTKTIHPSVWAVVVAQRAQATVLRLEDGSFDERADGRVTACPEVPVYLARFTANVDALKQWRLRNSGWPSTISTVPETRRLGKWLNQCRVRTNPGARDPLPDDRRALLDRHVPGWNGSSLS